MARQMAISIVKASDKTSIVHNNRSMSASELNKLNHIDQERLNKNEYLVDISIEEIYEREFAEALQKYNDKQKRSDRKIANYYEHILQSNKHMPQQEIIFQVGEHKDFAHEQTREMAKDILRNHFERFQKDNPNLKIYNAVIHDDEATPHLHVNFVPVADGYKRGLEKQVSYDRALLQQNPNLNQVQPFTEWRAQQVMQLEQDLNRKNIERKIVGTKDFKNQKEFKLKQDLGNEILALKSEKDYIEQESSKEHTKLNELKARTARLDKIAGIESTKAQRYADERLKHVKPTIFNKEMVQIPKKDLEDLEKAFKGASISNERVLKRNKELESTNETLVVANKNLSRTNNSLDTKVDRLERKVNDLEQDQTLFEQIFNLFKPYLQKYHDHIQAMLNQTPFTEGLNNLLKGFVAGTLADEGFSHAKDIALFANHNGYESALENYEIGATLREHAELQENQFGFDNPRSRGMSM